MSQTMAPANPTTAPADVRRMPLHDEVSRHARELWERYGRPEGRDTEIWLEAERQLIGADPKVRAAGGGAVAAPALAAARRAQN